MTECYEWSAWYNHMPGQRDEETLHVAGKCKLESSSFEVSLEPGDEGLVDEPDLYVLQLTIHRPSSGDDMVEEREVAWSGKAPGIKRVRIQGDAEADIEVTITQ